MKREYKVIMLLILVISIVALVLTSSYALFSFEEKGKIENKLVTGVYSSCEYEDGTTWNFDYTGSEQTFTVPCDGEYKLETWGAQGGSYNEEYEGGYGGYSSGTASIKENDKLYVNVGGLGNIVNDFSPVIPGGYNGGGDAYVIKESCSNYASSGGGATHIAFTSGILKNVEKNSLFIVSGGGGGANHRYCSTADTQTTNGGSAGGYLGSSLDKIKTLWNYVKPTGGTQTSGGLAGTHNTESGSTAGSYGQGGSYTRTGGHTSAIGGGGGFYGGGGGMFIGGGGGSGYIGNSILTNKVMYCYNCEESAEVSTKTVSTTCISQTPTENCSKQGNGYARVTLVKADKPINKYKEAILNETDPVLKDNLIPIKIASDGTVTKADISKEWYKYENKEWANAVILKDESITYNNGETIPEDNIESYFVWIPRYKYQIFDEGNYTGLTSFQDKTQTINVVFENKDKAPSNGTTKGNWLTHPAFTSFDSNGFWVGKFETGYDKATSTAASQVNSVDTSKIIIKPNVYSWRYITVGNAFKNSYDYQRNLDSHMMKNTEWGAMAYLQHSNYGSHVEIKLNNNSNYITGYATTKDATSSNCTIGDANRYEGTNLNTNGTYTVMYNTDIGKLASTTANITGIYDTAGGAWDYVSAYSTSISSTGGSTLNNFYPNFFTDSKYKKYWDKYTTTYYTQYNTRILGDATGELGPFAKNPNTCGYDVSSWYNDYAMLSQSPYPWLLRGGYYNYGTLGGIFAYSRWHQDGEVWTSYRIVLTP